MVYYGNDIYVPNTLYHHGIKGQKWGRRRFQNSDGTLTSEGKRRYYESNSGGGGAGIVENFDDKLEEIKSLQTEDQIQQKLKELEDIWISVETKVPKANEIDEKKKQLRYIETLQNAANAKMEELKKPKNMDTAQQYAKAQNMKKINEFETKKAVQDYKDSQIMKKAYEDIDKSHKQAYQKLYDSDTASRSVRSKESNDREKQRKNFYNSNNKKKTSTISNISSVSKKAVSKGKDFVDDILNKFKKK